MHRVLAYILPIPLGLACSGASEAGRTQASPTPTPANHSDHANHAGDAVADDDADDAAADHDADHGASYTCPMHPEIVKSEQGSCPKCGMTLVPVEHDEEGGEHHQGSGGHMGGTMGGPNMADHMAHMDDVRQMLQDRLGDAYDTPVAGLDSADLSAGKELYDSMCASCHGTSGKGDGPAAGALPTPPADHTDPVHSAYYSDAGRIEVIRNGIPGTPMAGFGAALSDADLLNLYAYVKSLRVEDGKGEHGEHAHPHDH